MACEKQFLPANNTFLYCSEACRIRDLAPTYSSHAHSYTPASTSPPQPPYTRQSSSLPTPYSPEDGPDIVPRLSPTQSRPRSYFNSEPYPSPYQPHPPTTSSSTPPTTSSRSSTALASLRELATSLPKIPTSKDSSSETDNSPPKPTTTSASISRTGSGVWNYMPFTSGSKTATPTPSTTPGSSYTATRGYTVSTSYGGAASTYGEEKGYGLGISTTGVAGYGNTGGMGMDRPLPPRSGPGGYGHRPQSIDLVTPYSPGH